MKDLAFSYTAVNQTLLNYSCRLLFTGVDKLREAGRDGRLLVTQLVVALFVVRAGRFCRLVQR